MKFENAIAQDCYDTMAPFYPKMVEGHISTLYYNQPAIMSLLPDINGKNVLDAGCGIGQLSQALLQKGANVTSTDVSEEMLKIAKKNLGSKAKIFQADLAEPLDFIEDQSLDVVIASLSMHYIKDWHPVFQEFCRILRPGGEVIFSTHHPVVDFKLSPNGMYHDIELIEDTWYRYGNALEVRYYRRSFSEIFEPLLSAGLIIKKIHEPLPLPESKEIQPEAYEMLSQKPKFLYVRSQKPHQ